ncbi:MAG: FKBP-type peptidyl-prolyl cis-trans isomerase [Gammaproteobacteria bacterium]|nr:FKBP-type peptidyl-prolyl cis-trans isomerase [Gammaproteobacteria bacterium]
MLCPVVAGAAVLLVACQDRPGAGATAALTTEDQKAIYAYGAVIGRRTTEQIAQLRLTPEEMAVFRSGFGDALAGKELALKIEDYEKPFQALAESRVAAGTAEAQKAGADLLASAAREPGAVKTESGLVFRTLKAGTGPNPKASDTVRVHYHGTLPDGKVFDSSVDRGEPAEFPLNGVIPCWTEGVQRMKVGEKARLVCPAAIAYGERGAGGVIPPGATLSFEVELLGIVG